MAHIIFKTTKPSLSQAKPVQPVAEQSAALQPMVIDFSKHRARLISPKILYALLGALVSFVITSLFALFMLGDQLNHLWRDAQHVTVEHSAKLAAQKAAEPEAAFPAATIAPLPSKAFILGHDFQKKDFQKTKPPNKLDLVPMLEKLPVYGQPAKPARPHYNSGYVEVETAPTLSQSTDLQQQADEAVANGQTDKALQLYLRAVRLTPNDAALHNNCVALLLQQARSFDEQGDVPQALTAYKKAQSLWRGDAQTAHGIQARIDFLAAR